MWWCRGTGGGGGHGSRERGRALLPVGFLRSQEVTVTVAMGQTKPPALQEGPLLAAPAPSLALHLLKLPAKGLDWHLPVLFLLLRFVFLSSLLQTFLWDPRRN